jgi:hypothetical protein
VSDLRVRMGTEVSAAGHVDYPHAPLAPLPSLIWSWGDGTGQAIAAIDDQVDSTAIHAYDRPGSFTITLEAVLNGVHDSATATIQVDAPRPAVAVFVPLYVERAIPALEQQAIADAIESTLLARGTEVEVFEYDRQGELEAWMSEYQDDGVVDVLVVLDLAPDFLYGGEIDGSQAELWLEAGNGIVWTGQFPFYEYIDETADTRVRGGNVADRVLDAATGLLMYGAGLQTPNALAAGFVPSFSSYNAKNALRYDQVGNGWKVRMKFAEDGDKDSDAILIQHTSGGFYAQFYCLNLPSVPRQDVLVEFLERWPLGTRIPK